MEVTFGGRPRFASSPGFLIGLRAGGWSHGSERSTFAAAEVSPRRRGFVERDTAGVLMRMDGTEAMVTVVVAESGDAHLLGATALETLGFGIDPIRKLLVPQSLLAM